MSPRLAQEPCQPGQVDGGGGEHGPAFAIEVAGDDVDGIDQPRGKTAEFLGTGAHASVPDCPRGGGKVERELSDRLGLDSHDARHPFGRELLRRGQQLLLAAKALKRSPSHCPFG